MTNKVVLRGTISTIEFSHESHGVKLYKTTVSVMRNSGVEDVIPVIIPEKTMLELINQQILVKNKGSNTYECLSTMTVTGEYRSLNKLNGERHKLELYVFARDITKWEGEDGISSINQIELDCYVCKMSECRQTPFNKTICDMIVAVNNEKLGKSNYIPCIIWGDEARIACEDISIGEEIHLLGRVQSREYFKNNVSMTAYEVSVSKIW